MPKRRKNRVGDYLITCDLSGQTFWASDTVKTWNGFRVGKKFDLPRNPQDFPKFVKDDLAVPDAKPFIPEYEEPEYGVFQIRTTPLDISGYYQEDILETGGGEPFQLRY